MSRNSKHVQILLVISFLFLGFAPVITPKVKNVEATANEAQVSEKFYTVFAEQTLRQFPRADSRPTDAQEVHLTKGNTVKYLAKAPNNFFKVQVDGVVGYVNRDYVTSTANYEKLINEEIVPIADVKTEKEERIKDEYSVITDAVIRSRDLDHASPVRLVKRGDRVEYLGSTENRYFKVKINGQKGYIFRGDLTADLDKAATNFKEVPVKNEKFQKLQAVVNTNIRARDNRESAPAAELKKDEIVTYLGTVQRDNSWLMIKNNQGRKGYIQRGDVTAVHSESPAESEVGYQAFDINAFDIVKFNTEFLSLVNEERTRVGVCALKYKPNLQTGTNMRATEMRNAYQISHTRPNGELFTTAFNYLYDYPANYLGENVAYRPVDYAVEMKVNEQKSTFEKEYAKLFFDQYRISPGHYNNMIKKNYQSLAVGLDERNNRLFNVMIFSTLDP